MKTCQWCDREAVTSIVLEPTRYRSTTKKDPVTGERVPTTVVAQFEICADACEQHRNVADRPAGQPLADPRRKKAEGIEQATVYDFLEGGPKNGPADAIRGDAA